MSVAQSQLEQGFLPPLTLVDGIGAPAVPEALPRPSMRGMFHQAAFFIAVPAAVNLVRLAHTDRARLATVVYGIGLCALYAVSASYHRLPWGPLGKRRMRRADHATIFVMIAGTYTPLCLLVLQGSFRIGLLVAVWAGAIAGIALTVTGVAERRGVDIVLYFVLGWLALAAIPQIASRVSSGSITLLVAGGLVYTVGSVVLGRHWPDPVPRTFGYHEVWHTMVIAASICHYLLILSIVRAV